MARPARRRARVTDPDPAAEAALLQTQSRLLTLPLRGIGWAKFQTFARDFAAEIPGVARAVQWGVHGDKQDGIDVMLTRVTGEARGIQCKDVAIFGKTGFDKAVIEMTADVDDCWIFVAGRISKPARDAIALDSKFEGYDADDISHEMRRLPLATQVQLIETHFGAQVRAAFCGIHGPRSFLTRMEVRAHPLVAHDLPLIGREVLLAQLEQSVAGDSPVTLLSGTGGAGKSRVIMALAERLDRPRSPWLVRFLNPGVPLTAEALDEIPPEPCVVIVDDAHKRVDDCRLLIAWALQRPVAARLVLVTRPRAVDAISALAFRQGANIKVLPEVRGLSRVDSIALARTVLGSEHAEWADPLAKATRDCPLMTVVGGRLLLSHGVHPGMLAVADAFSRTVLTAFRTELLAAVGSRPDLVCALPLLDRIAALQPIMPDHSDIVSRLSDDLGATVEDVRSVLRLLSDEGLTVRTGRLVRISPDVLADDILAGACLDERGRSTGFANQMVARYASVALANLLRNFAELDWRGSVSAGSIASVLDSIWRDIEAVVLDSESAVEVQDVILAAVEDAAVFVPERVLSLARQLVEVLEVDPDLDAKRGLYGFSRRNLTFRLGRLLRDAAWSPEHLREAANLLWRLAALDSRTRMDGDHPLALLRDLISYDLEKPYGYTEVMVATCLDWLKSAPQAGGHTPFDVLDSVHLKIGTSNRSDGLTFSVRSFPIMPADTERFRTPALEAAMQAAMGSDAKLAIRAVASLADAAQPGFAFNGQSLPPAFHRTWSPAEADAVGALGRVASEAPIRVVRLAALSALRLRGTVHPRNAPARAARAIVATLKLTFEDLLVLQIASHGPLRWADDVPTRKATGGTVKRREQAREQALARVAGELVSAASTAADVLDRISAAHQSLVAAGIDANPIPLTAAVAAATPDRVDALIAALLGDPAHPIGSALLPLLYALRSADADAALSVAGAMLESAVVAHTRLVAHVCRSSWWQPQPPTSEDVALIRTALASPDPETAAIAVQALPRLAEYRRDDAIRLLMNVDLSDALVLNAWCHELGEHGHFKEVELDDHALGRVLDRIRDVADLRTEGVDTFLDREMTSRPLAVVAMILDRIDAGATPLSAWPYSWEYGGERGIPATQRRAVLQAVFDRSQSSSTYFCARLFALLDHMSSDDAIGVLQDAAATEDASTLERVASFVCELRPEVLLKRADLVDQFLTKASSAGPMAVKRMRSAMLISATPKSTSGKVGEPRPQLVAAREHARTLAARNDLSGQVRSFYEDVAHQAEEWMDMNADSDSEMLDSA